MNYSAYKKKKMAIKKVQPIGLQQSEFKLKNYYIDKVNISEYSVPEVKADFTIGENLKILIDEHGARIMNIVVNNVVRKFVEVIEERLK